MITEQERDESLQWLLDFADEVGRSYGGMKVSETAIKVAEAKGIRESDSGAVEAKRAYARTTDDYIRAVETYGECCAEYTTLATLKQYHHARLDAFRTQQSDRRGLDTRF